MMSILFRKKILLDLIGKKKRKGKERKEGRRKKRERDGE